MSFLCLLVFFVCVLHNSSLTLDVFFTEHGCNHWVGWGEFLLSKFSATAICQASFCFLLPSLNILWLLPGFDFDVTFSEFLKLFLSYMYSLSFNWFHNTLLLSYTLLCLLTTEACKQPIDSFCWCKYPLRDRNNCIPILLIISIHV